MARWPHQTRETETNLGMEKPQQIFPFSTLAHQGRWRNGRWSNGWVVSAGAAAYQEQPWMVAARFILSVLRISGRDGRLLCKKRLESFHNDAHVRPEVRLILHAEGCDCCQLKEEEDQGQRKAQWFVVCGYIFMCQQSKNSSPQVMFHEIALD